MPMKKNPFLILVGLALLAESVLSAELYVARSGSHAYPFKTLETAATNLQSAVDAAAAGDLIRVAPGVYNQGAYVARLQGVSNRVVFDRNVVMRSLEGPEVTVIDGAGAMRCVYLSQGAELCGFTIRNGLTGEGESGAGVLAMDASRVVDCVITNCISGEEGGAVYGGIVERCRLIDNRAYAGGGAADSQLEGCLLWKNMAASVGGGASASSLNFCTVVENSAERSGGGVYHGRVSNSIVYYNICPGPGRNYFFGSMLKSCTRPLPAWSAGQGNIEAEPRFLDRANGQFMLTLMSPCIDAAEAGVSTHDLLGRPRALDGDNDGTDLADMGAFEYVHPSADSDGDGVTDFMQFQLGKD